jgi:hypothetical protein
LLARRIFAGDRGSHLCQ